MTALCDRPNLPADELSHMISLAMPWLKPFWSDFWGYGTKKRLTFRTSFKKYNDELFVFFNYHPDTSQANRWSITHEGKIGAEWRDIDFFKKKSSKRFASLIDAIAYYETEIKR